MIRLRLVLHEDGARRFAMPWIGLTGNAHIWTPPFLQEAWDG